MTPFKRQATALFVCGLWCAHAFGQAAPAPSAPPRQDWQTNYETSNGAYAGDNQLSQQPTIDYWGDPNQPSDWDSVYITAHDGHTYYSNVNGVVPHTDSVDTFNAKVQAAGTHAANLHALRDLTTTETTRMAKDTGAMGQAMAVTNNSSLSARAAKPTVAGTVNLGSSAYSLNNAGNNALLQQTFSGCADSVQSYPGSDGGNQYQTKACSFVQLKYTPGFAAHVYRTVTATFPSEFDLWDNTNYVLAFGATDNWHGTLATTFPATTTTLTSFDVSFYRLGNGPMPAEFTYSAGTIPSKANGWSYNFWISREAQPNPVPSYDTPGAPIFVRIEWTYQGDPVYNFSKPICDKGDCTITGDEFCKAKWTCNTKLPSMSTNGYLVPVTAANGPPPIGPLYTLIQQLDPTYATDLQTDDICMDATENIDCSGIYSGNYCVPGDTPGSPPVCSTVPPGSGLPNDCPQIASDPTCHQSGTVCAEDGQSRWDGYCYVMTEQFTCYVPTPVSNGNVTTITTCPGNQPCMDGSCLTYDKRQNVGYSRTRALGQQVIAQHFLSDWETQDEYAHDPLNLTNDGNAYPGNGANGGGTAAAAMADYKRLLKAQARMRAEHPNLTEQLRDATKTPDAPNSPTSSGTETHP